MWKTSSGYMEYTGDDFEADMARVAEDEETQRWWQLAGPCQQPVESAGPGEWWAPMTSGVNTIHVQPSAARAPPLTAFYERSSRLVAAAAACQHRHLAHTP